MLHINFCHFSIYFSLHKKYTFNCLIYLSPQHNSCLYFKLSEQTERNNSAFGEELSILGHCDNRRQRSNGKLSPKVKQKGQTSSRQQPFKCVNSLSTDVHQKVSSVAAQNSKRSDHIDFHVSEWQPECFGK